MILVLWAFAVQDISVDDLYLFPPGTRWTYTCDKTELSYAVKSVEKGKVLLDYKESRPNGGKPRQATFVWYVEGGMLKEGEWVDGKIRPSMCLFKVGARAGDKWPAPSEEDAETHAVFVGMEQVETPAGKFRAARVRMSFHRDTVVREIYLAPKVGLVRVEISDGRRSTKIELTSFSGLEAKPAPAADRPAGILKFNAGTTWTFDHDLVLKVTKVEGERLTVRVRDKTDESRLVWEIKEGFLVWSRLNDDGKISESLKVLKLGAQAGEAWDASGDVHAKHLGMEELKTAAGVFKAQHVRFVDDRSKQETNLYFDPALGPVRIEEGIDKYELNKFAGGKE